MLNLLDRALHGSSGGSSAAVPSRASALPPVAPLGEKTFYGVAPGARYNQTPPAPVRRCKARAKHAPCRWPRNMRADAPLCASCRSRRAALLSTLRHAAPTRAAGASKARAAPRRCRWRFLMTTSLPLPLPTRSPRCQRVTTSQTQASPWRSRASARGSVRFSSHARQRSRLLKRQRAPCTTQARSRRRRAGSRSRRTCACSMRCLRTSCPASGLHSLRRAHSVSIAASIAGEDDIFYQLPIQGIITQLWCAYKNDDQIMWPVR
jgi:hypothetical protein